MVLLTASAVSTVISGGIICTFTFLLFLSGYVLQQQTVRSLQEALRNPPDRISLPIPSLPEYFQENEENTLHLKSGQSEDQVVLVKSSSRFTKHKEAEKALRLLWQDYVSGFNSSSEISRKEVDNSSDIADRDDVENMTAITSRESLAYIFTLADTDSLCSAVLFVKRHTEITSLTSPPSMVFLYPATWDVSDEDDHVAAMDILRDMQDSFSVTLHPVTISRVWAGITTQQQLLAELQRYRWPYQRALYLASPGLSINTVTLDEALALSDRGAWTLLHPKPKSQEALNPSMLFWAAGRGLQYPRHEMKTLITSLATLSNKGARSGASPAEEMKLAGYVLISGGETSQTDYGHQSIVDMLKLYEADKRATCSVAEIIET